MGQEKKALESLIVGEISRAHGIQGELFVRLLTADHSWIDGMTTLELHSPNGGSSKKIVLKSKRIHKGGVILRSPDVKTRNDAEDLRGWQIKLPEDYFKSAVGERIYLAEVLGFEVLAIETENGDRSQVLASLNISPEYDPFVMPVKKSQSEGQGTSSEEGVAGLARSEASTIGSIESEELASVDRNKATWVSIGFVEGFLTNGPQDIIVVNQSLVDGAITSEDIAEGVVDAEGNEDANEEILDVATIKKQLVAEEKNKKMASKINKKIEQQKKNRKRKNKAVKLTVDVPFIDQFVLDIDFDRKLIRMMLPEGLI